MGSSFSRSSPCKALRRHFFLLQPPLQEPRDAGTREGVRASRPAEYRRVASACTVPRLRMLRPCLAAASLGAAAHSQAQRRGRRGSLAPPSACLLCFACRGGPRLPHAAIACGWQRTPAMRALTGEDTRPAATPPGRGHRLSGPYASSSSDACPSSSRVSRSVGGHKFLYYSLHFKSNDVVRSKTLQNIFYSLEQSLQRHISRKWYPIILHETPQYLNQI